MRRRIPPYEGSFPDIAGPLYAARMTPADYALIEGATCPHFSRDGRTLFHLRGHPAQLWALDLATGQTRPLTQHDERVAMIRRAPKDDRIIYGIDAGGDERQQLWLWDGASRPLTDAPGVIHGFGAWHPDGTRISMTANDRDEAHFDVLTLDLTTGERTGLHQGRHEVTVGAWHPNGTRLVAMTEHATGDVRPFILDLDGGATPLARAAPADFARLRWKSGALLGLTDAGRDFRALCRFDDGITPVFAPDADVDAWAMAPGGESLATVENRGGYGVLRLGPLNGDRPDIALPPGVVSEPSWSADGSMLAFSLSTPTEPPALWVWEDGAARCVWRADPVPAIPFEAVEWTGHDGLRIPGWLARPRGVPLAPAVVWVHGGPASESRPRFRADMQALLAEGIAVLMPNVRGSTGLGRQRMMADDLARRLDSVADLAAGGRWLAAQPGIDPTRIAVMGQSYGGFMVLSALTEYPELWRCGIDFYGISDFGTLLAGTGPWRRAHRAAEYGEPVRHRALFDRISPLGHVDRIAAPLLVLHGTRDPRVAIAESEQLVEAMGQRGKAVAYEVFDDAGHGFVRAADRVRAWEAVADFLRRTL